MESSVSSDGDISLGLGGHFCFSGSPLDCSIHHNSIHAESSMSSGPSLTNDRFGRTSSAYHFNRKNGEYFSITAGSSLHVNTTTTGLSISAWIRLTSDSDKHFTLVSKEFPTFYYMLQGMGHEMKLGHEHATVPQPGHELGQCPSITPYPTHAPKMTISNTPIPSHEWTHVTITHDGCNQHFYVNGELKDVTNHYFHIAPSTAGEWFLGNMGCGARCETFDGDMDEIRIYTRPLNVREVQQVYMDCSSENICHNNGKCTMTNSAHGKFDYQCACPAGFTGKHCEHTTGAHDHHDNHNQRNGISSTGAASIPANPVIHPIPVSSSPAVPIDNKNVARKMKQLLTQTILLDEERTRIRHMTAQQIELQKQNVDLFQSRSMLEAEQKRWKHEKKALQQQRQMLLIEKQQIEKEKEDVIHKLDQESNDRQKQDQQLQQKWSSEVQQERQALIQIAQREEAQIRALKQHEQQTQQQLLQLKQQDQTQQSLLQKTVQQLTDSQNKLQQLMNIVSNNVQHQKTMEHHVTEVVHTSFIEAQNKINKLSADVADLATLKQQLHAEQTLNQKLQQKIEQLTKQQKDAQNAIQQAQQNANANLLQTHAATTTNAPVNAATTPAIPAERLPPALPAWLKNGEYTEATVLPAATSSPLKRLAARAAAPPTPAAPAH